MFQSLPYDEYRALHELAEDAGDTSALIRFAKRYATGEEECIPLKVIDRTLSGESPLRVWREHRGLSAKELAAALEVTPAHISKLESGKGEPSIALLRKLSKVFQVDLDHCLLRVSGFALAYPPHRWGSKVTC